jgi:RimJ/RimL family protein N-acetyltransferase
MAINVDCPKCGQTLRLQDEYLGRRVRCPRWDCGHHFIAELEDDSLEGDPPARSPGEGEYPSGGTNLAELQSAVSSAKVPAIKGPPVQSGGLTGRPKLAPEDLAALFGDADDSGKGKGKGREKDRADEDDSGGRRMPKPKVVLEEDSAGREEEAEDRSERRGKGKGKSRVRDEDDDSQTASPQLKPKSAEDEAAGKATSTSRVGPIAVPAPKRLTAPVGVYLRPLRADDLDSFDQWLNDAESKRTHMGVKALAAVRDAKKYEVLGRIDEDVTLAVCSKQNDRLLGCIGLYEIDWRNRSGRFEILITETNQKYLGKGFISGAVRTMIEYGFRELSLHRLWVKIYDNNPRGRQLYARVGFTEEGRLKQAYFCEGRFWDVLVWGMLAPDYFEAKRAAKSQDDDGDD